MISNHISHTVSSKTISGQFWRYIMQLPVTVTHRFIICLMSLSGMKTIGLPTNDDWVNRALNINGKLFFFKSNRKYWRTDIVGGSWVWVGGWFVFFFILRWFLWYFEFSWLEYFSSWDTVQKTVAYNQNSLYLSVLSSILKRNQILVVHTERFKAFSLKLNIKKAD